MELLSQKQLRASPGVDGVRQVPPVRGDGGGQPRRLVRLREVHGGSLCALTLLKVTSARCRTTQCRPRPSAAGKPVSPCWARNDRRECTKVTSTSVSSSTYERVGRRTWHKRSQGWWGAPVSPLRRFRAPLSQLTWPEAVACRTSYVSCCNHHIGVASIPLDVFIPRSRPSAATLAQPNSRLNLASHRGSWLVSFKSSVTAVLGTGSQLRAGRCGAAQSARAVQPSRDAAQAGGRRRGQGRHADFEEEEST